MNNDEQRERATPPDPDSHEAQLIEQKRRAGQKGGQQPPRVQPKGDGTSPEDWLSEDGSIIVSGVATPGSRDGTPDSPTLDADQSLKEPESPVVLDGNRTQPTPTYRLGLPLAIFAGIVVVGLLGLWMFRPSVPTSLSTTSSPIQAPTERAPTAATTAITSTGTITGTTPMTGTDRTATLRERYSAGREAYAARRWEQAATAFEQARAIDADYLDLPQALASTYYNWGVATLSQQPLPANQRNVTEAARQRFGLALKIPLPPDEEDELYRPISDTHGLANKAIEVIDTYDDGVAAQKEKRWADAVEKLEEVQQWAVVNPLIDTPGRLYAVYLTWAKELGDNGQSAEAGELLDKASKLPDADAKEIAGLRAQIAPPPTATPKPAASARRNFKAVPVSDFQGTGNNGTFESCISGRITYNGRGIDSAVIGVNNGNVNFRAVSGGGGNYRLCGLGASPWSVVLFFIPGSPPLGNQPVTVVYVNGNRAQEAVVNFTGP